MSTSSDGNEDDDSAPTVHTVTVTVQPMRPEGDAGKAAKSSSVDDNDDDDDDSDDVTSHKSAVASYRGKTHDSMSPTDNLTWLKEHSRSLWLFVTLRSIADPNTNFKFVWDWTIIVMVVYNCFTVPFYMSFDLELANDVKAADTLVTVFMFIDIFLNFRTGYQDVNANIVYDSTLIAQRYYQTGLLYDVLGTFPVDLFAPLVEGDSLFITNCMKGTNLLRTWRLAYNPRLTAFNSPQARIGKLLFGFFVCAHFFASAFFFVGKYQQGMDTSWIITKGLEDASVGRQYVASLYWALTTMVTVGYGDIVPVTVYEQLTVIPILLISALIYATIFGNMAYAIETLSATYRRYQSQIDYVKEFAAVYEIPSELEKKLYDYTNAMWNQTKGFETEAMLAHLPNSVKADVYMYLNHTLIQRVPLFKQCSDRFLEAIILRMHSQVCLQGDYVFKQGDKSREMYFVRSGSVDIIMEETDAGGVERVIAEIGSFSESPYFGEISLLLGETRTASARAREKCVFSCLTQQDFFEVLSMFPDEENTLRETATARLEADIEREQKALKKAGSTNVARQRSYQPSNTMDSAARHPTLAASELVSIDEHESFDDAPPSNPVGNNNRSPAPATRKPLSVQIPLSSSGQARPSSDGSESPSPVAPRNAATNNRQPSVFESRLARMQTQHHNRQDTAEQQVATPKHGQFTAANFSGTSLAEARKLALTQGVKLGNGSLSSPLVSPTHKQSTSTIGRVTATRASVTNSNEPAPMQADAAATSSTGAELHPNGLRRRISPHHKPKEEDADAVTNRSMRVQITPSMDQVDEVGATQSGAASTALAKPASPEFLVHVIGADNMTQSMRQRAARKSAVMSEMLVAPKLKPVAERHRANSNDHASNSLQAPSAAGAKATNKSMDLSALAAMRKKRDEMTHHAAHKSSDSPGTHSRSGSARHLYDDAATPALSRIPSTAHAPHTPIQPSSRSPHAAHLHSDCVAGAKLMEERIVQLEHQVATFNKKLDLIISLIPTKPQTHNAVGRSELVVTSSTMIAEIRTT